MCWGWPTCRDGIANPLGIANPPAAAAVQRRLCVLTRRAAQRPESPLLPCPQDYNYIVADTFEVTLELSLTKSPPAEVLHAQWLENKDAMLRFPMVAAFGG